MSQDSGRTRQSAGASPQPAGALDDRDARPAEPRTPSVGFAVHRPIRAADGAIVDFEYLHVNGPGARLVGVTAAELIGQRVTAVEPQATVVETLATYTRVMDTGEPDEREVHYLHDDLDSAVQRIVVPVDGSVAVTFSVIMRRAGAEADADDLRLNSERAAAQAARILERVSDAHITLDRAFRIVSLNTAAARSLDQPRERLVGHTFWEVAPVTADSEAGQLFRRVVADGSEGHATHRMADTGDGVHWELEAYPTDDGGVAVFWRDVTTRVSADAFQQEFTARLGSWNRQLQANAAERERLLAAAEHARGEAEEANRTKTQFLATMSHELRTPLNAIGGYVQLMEIGIHGPVTDAQREDLARIQRNQRHLLGLINAVLNHAQLKSGAVTFETEDVIVGDAAIAATTLVAPQLHAAALTLDVHEISTDVVVRADAEKLRQILLNLLSNAIKFTRPGGAIAVRCVMEGDQVAIGVSDTGIGIPAQHLRRVFDPFVQVDAGLKRTHEGVGLGLAISRDLARGMDGDLTASSEVGIGSTFTLRLPRVHAAAGTAGAARGA